MSLKYETQSYFDVSNASRIGVKNKNDKPQRTLPIILPPLRPKVKAHGIETVKMKSNSTQNTVVVTISVTFGVLPVYQTTRAKIIIY